MSRQKIDALRGQIKTLQRERTALQDQRYSRAEVAAKVRQMVLQWESEAAHHNAQRLQWMAHGDHGAELLAADCVHGLSTGNHAALGPAFVAMLGAEVVSARLLAGIDQVPEGLDKAERLARIAAIGDELDRLEAEEERLISAAEAQGVEVLRRGDARPEIVLAITA